jgi:beta-lactam-binding protein with PASTA domain
VPSVLGLSPADARQALEDAGFGIQARVQREPLGPGSDGRLDKVWKQAPIAGAAAPAGSTVTVWVNPATPDTTTSTATTVSTSPP